MAKLIGRAKIRKMMKYSLKGVSRILHPLIRDNSRQSDAQHTDNQVKEMVISDTEFPLTMVVTHDIDIDRNGSKQEAEDEIAH